MTGPHKAPGDLSNLLDGEPFSPYKILNHFDRLQAVAQGENVFPITVEIDPANVCNHRCEWCVSMLAHTGERLDYEAFARLVEELERLEVRSVVLKGGGEPTVHPRFNDMLARLAETELAVGLITNGSMRREGTLDSILK